MTQPELNHHPPHDMLSMLTVPTEQIHDQLHAFKEKRAFFQRMVMVPVVVLALNAAMIFAIAFMQDAIVAAKVLLIEVMTTIALTSLGIALAHAHIKEALLQAEEIAHFARDQAFVELNMVRETLEGIRQKLSRDEKDAASGAIPELLKTVGPFVMLFIQKEKSIFRWGMLGLKIAQNAMAILKERSKSQ